MTTEPTPFPTAFKQALDRLIAEHFPGWDVDGTTSFSAMPNRRASVAIDLTIREPGPARAEH